MMKPISAEENARIAEAVAAAEGGTSGEIRCVLALESSDPRLSAVFWAAAWALVLPPLAALAGFRYEDIGHRLAGSPWTEAHLTVADAGLALTVYATVQAVIFGVVLLVAGLPAVRRALTPATRQTRQVRAAAEAQFHALGLTQTRDRTGILLYVSLAEHRAQVLADEGIYATAPPQVWDEVVALLIEGLKRDAAADGFVSAVRRTGEILAASLPRRDGDRNELPDGLVETGRQK